ncbi:hypothetical protein A2482_02880 [Candidatus Falkowbacteria bacterium RIFOXYC2_FULL_48_21]|uniref:Segregation and condensation protein A n=1 Tax=Candidatus Falkowbacteria bacterium RIFOXYC2_FULL_48_21 TaxID=1798005 RepID=A0A1F5TGN7_9BACT|nr:MAG: hypothetical protein A2482_02880 [Candidatus Falkowbacteria bacterium RIFOXYC2_FULL_48_21]
MYEIKSEKFNGPLDLLLQLIEGEKLEITEISIAQVTDQFLAYIEKMEEKNPEELADFLFVAARLLLLKSKAILPEIDEEGDLDDLEKQLKLYKEFVEASKKINALILEKRFTFSRERPPFKTDVEFSPPPELKTLVMQAAMLAVLRRLDPLVKIPRQIMERTISLQQKILEIKDFLAKQTKFGFRSLIESAKTKTEVIMNFLALLELVKQRHLKLKQTKNFDDIMIEKL